MLVPKLEDWGNEGLLSNLKYLNNKSPRQNTVNLLSLELCLLKSSRSLVEGL